MSFVDLRPSAVRSAGGNCVHESEGARKSIPSVYGDHACIFAIPPSTSRQVNPLYPMREHSFDFLGLFALIFLCCYFAVAISTVLLVRRPFAPCANTLFFWLSENAPSPLQYLLRHGRPDTQAFDTQKILWTDNCAFCILYHYLFISSNRTKVEH